MTEKVAITVRFNKNIHEALTKYKKLTGLSINSQVYSAVAAWLFQKKLLTLNEIDAMHKKSNYRYQK